MHTEIYLYQYKRYYVHSSSTSICMIVHSTSIYIIAVALAPSMMYTSYLVLCTMYIVHRTYVRCTSYLVRDVTLVSRQLSRLLCDGSDNRTRCVYIGEYTTYDVLQVCTSYEYYVRCTYVHIQVYIVALPCTYVQVLCT